MTKVKKYVCSQLGCGRSFTRSDHLRRHMLNHSTGNSTCTRCRLHFKRPDLLHRHIARHQQKDRDAGGPGLGIVESRKKMWLDADGNIVSRRPAPSATNGELASHTQAFSEPPPSLSVESFEKFSLQHPELSCDHPIVGRRLHGNMFEFLANSSWGHRSPLVPTLQMDAYNEFAGNGIEPSFNASISMVRGHDRLFGLDAEPHIPYLNSEEIDTMTAGYSCNSLDISLPSPLQSRSEHSADSFMPPHQLDPSSRHLESSFDYLWPFFGVNGPVDSHCSFLPAASAGQASDCIPSCTLTVGAHRSSPERAKLSVLQDRPNDFSSTSKPTIDAASRERILKVVSAAQPTFSDNTNVDADHALLSPYRLQKYLDLFFTYFNVAYPLIHRPTFDTSRTEALLLLAILLLGATYSDPPAHCMAVCIHDVLRAQVFQHEGFSATPQLWVLQTLLLLDAFGKSRAGQKQHEAAQAFHGLLINLIRKSDYQSTPSLVVHGAGCSPQQLWRKAIEAEHRKRLAFICFLWDTQYALFFSQPLCMSALELRTALPCTQDTWNAPTAEEWWDLAKDDEQVSFLAVLKAHMTANSQHHYQLDAFAHLLVLHGIMSMQWDTKRRSQTSLGMVVSNATQDSGDSWKETFERSYYTWKTDFDKYCRAVTVLPNTKASKRAEFRRFTIATTAIYHAAHIALNVEILDLQICAGACHITGRVVSEADHARSWASLSGWVRLNGARSVTKAAFHAGELLRDGSLNLKIWDVNEASHYPWCFHYPWSLYLATITCWAFRCAVTTSEISCFPKATSRNHGLPFALLGTGQPGHSIRDSQAQANAFLSAIASVTPSNVRDVLKHSSTSGLTILMAHHLSSIRWAVIHEAVKVLRGLE